MRNTSGNLPNITNRITAHKKALRAVLPAGMARSHRGNPAASLRVHQQYGTAVLFSGLASLVLTPSEIRIIDQHFQKTVQNMQRLYDKTPRSVIFLLAGCLPGEAILHMKQLSLFSKVCHLPDDPLHLHGTSVLVSAQSSAKSWFLQILSLCIKYNLPHPHLLLKHPPPKPAFKKQVKKAVIAYWEDLLREEASALESLHYFLPQLHDLQTPHPLWTTAGSNSFECQKSCVLARMISGRLRTDYLSRHWTANKQGYCQLDTCQDIIGDLEHLLLACPGLESVRLKMKDMILQKTKLLAPLFNFVLKRRYGV